MKTTTDSFKVKIYTCGHLSSLCNMKYCDSNTYTLDFDFLYIKYKYIKNISININIDHNPFTLKFCCLVRKKYFCVHCVIFLVAGQLLPPKEAISNFGKI